MTPSLKTPELVPDATASVNGATQVESKIADAAILHGTKNGGPMRLCYFMSDLLALSVGLLVARIAMSFMAGVWWQPLSALEMKFFGLLGLGVIGVATSQRTYSAVPPKPTRQFRGWTLGLFGYTLLLTSVSWMFNLGNWQLWAGLFLATFVTHLLACFIRAYCRMMFGKKDWWGTRILVVGANNSANESMNFFYREPRWGLRPVGYVTEDEYIESDEHALPCLGTVQDLESVAEQTGIDRALVALSPIDLQELRGEFVRFDTPIQHWIIVPNIEGCPTLWLEWSEASSLPALSMTNRHTQRSANFLKRALDLAIVSTIAILFSPFLAVIAALVAVTSKGPTFYGHSRVGKNGKRFKVWKFRTMVQNADQCLEKYLEEHPELREEWIAKQKLKFDPRITSIGRFLRATSLDELPQLWNVFVGDMSIVGPRPITTSEANRYRSIFGHYQNVLPGITGLWQVSGRNDTTYEERIELDLYYVENWSVWLDLYILACTIKTVLMREGAY